VASVLQQYRRRRPVGQTPLLDYLPTSSSPLALFRSMVGEKGNFSFPFREPAMMALQDPQLSYPYLFLGVLSLQMNALRTRLL
jgi:hypothetical protein